MSEPLACVVTNGGPLIALPEELLVGWGGVTAGDYDRACEPPTDAVTIEDSFSTWTVRVDEGSALVLEGECSTTALRWDDGLVVLRDFGVQSIDEGLTLVAAVPDAGWIETPFSLSLASGRLFVFDSAYAGFEREEADGGILEAALVPGVYRVRVAVPPGGGRTTLVRLVGPPQPSPARGSLGVEVR